jgi:hypothetical protein
MLHPPHDLSMPVPQFETGELSGVGQPSRELDRLKVSLGVKNSLAQHFAGLAQEAESVHAHEIGPSRFKSSQIAGDCYQRTNRD